MFPPLCLVPRAQEEACKHRLWLVVQYHTGHEDTHTPAAPTPTEGGETSRGWMSWREQAWGLPRGGPCHPEGGRDGHTRASTAHSMTETPTWGQRLHSYSALHRAPDSHIRHSLLLPVLHLPHSLSCQLYAKRYEMTRPPSNVKPRPPPLCGPFGWTSCRWGAVHGQPRGHEGRPQVRSLRTSSSVSGALCLLS